MSKTWATVAVEYKMNANAQLLVSALRSGEYKQIKGCLSTGGGYCCLGVACEVYIKAGHTLDKMLVRSWTHYGGAGAS